VGPGADPSILQEGHENNNNNKIPSPYQLSDEAPVGFSFAFQKQISFAKFYYNFYLHMNFI
jgi:hypothetical protein